MLDVFVGLSQHALPACCQTVAIAPQLAAPSLPGKNLLARQASFVRVVLYSV